MRDAQQEFGIVRMGGTIGWIAASWPFIFLLDDKTAANLQEATGIAANSWTFIVAGVASIVLTAFSMTLPHTPPKPVTRPEEKLAWLKAMKFLALPYIFVLWLVTFVDSAVHQSYFNWTAPFLENRVGVAKNYIMVVMSVGQIAEIVTMMVLGMFLKRLGWRLTMILGILGHAARFAVFAYFPDQKNLVIAIFVLHGICYAFFFATVYIFVDEYFPKDVRASAQGLFNLMILGAGPLAANFLCPQLETQYKNAAGVINYREMFLLPCYAAIAAAVVLAIAFWPPKKSGQTPTADEFAPPPP
jgi:hypothetical protein